MWYRAAILANLEGKGRRVPSSRLAEARVQDYPGQLFEILLKTEASKLGTHTSAVGLAWVGQSFGFNLWD